MALGGMRDHIGGGFHRYSVDAAWRVPHFEKMLYDQAQLVLAYLEAAQVSGDPFYVDVAEDTLQLRHARDDRSRTAASIPPRTPTASRRRRPARPGRRTRRRARSTSGAPTKSTRCSVTTRRSSKRRFGIEADGNAPQDPQQEFTGKNLLYVAQIGRRHRRSEPVERRTTRSRRFVDARGCACSRRGSTGRGRISTTRC